MQDQFVFGNAEIKRAPTPADRTVTHPDMVNERFYFESDATAMATSLKLVHLPCPLILMVKLDNSGSSFVLSV